MHFWINCKPIAESPIVYEEDDEFNPFDESSHDELSQEAEGENKTESEDEEESHHERSEEDT